MRTDFWWENPPPHIAMAHDRQCPTVLAFADGRRYRCTLTVKAGRTKHAVVHKWGPVEFAEETKETTNL